MQTVEFTPAQKEVLNVVSHLKDEDVKALKDVLVQFLNTRIQAEMDELYDKGILSDEKMRELSKQHLRTPYK